MFRRPLVILLALLTTLIGGSAFAAAEKPEIIGNSPGLTAPDQHGSRAGWFVIRSLFGSGTQCLDADSTGGGNGTRVQVWDCNGSNQQLWFWADDLSVRNGLFPSMCLDADVNGGGANGTRAQLWVCNGSTQQQWGVLPNDVAIYNVRFFNNANTVLDRDTNVPGNGAQVQLWEKNFQPQQWWSPE